MGGGEVSTAWKGWAGVGLLLVHRLHDRHGLLTGTGSRPRGAQQLRAGSASKGSKGRLASASAAASLVKYTGPHLEAQLLGAVTTAMSERGHAPSAAHRFESWWWGKGGGGGSDGGTAEAGRFG